jgi:hypothetical protein
VDPSAALDPSGASFPPPLVLYKELRKLILPPPGISNQLPAMNNTEQISKNEQYVLSKLCKINNIYIYAKSVHRIKQFGS